MAVIGLTRGLVATVDDGDLDMVSVHSWYAHCTDRVWYARTSLPRRGRSHSPTMSMHRLILNAAPGQIVDHIDGDGLNNRRENLRFVSVSENRRNCHVVVAESGFKGVHRNNNATNPWQARLSKRHLGCFPTALEAALAYDHAAIDAFGEHARTNIPRALLEELRLLREVAEAARAMVDVMSYAEGSLAEALDVALAALDARREGT